MTHFHDSLRVIQARNKFRELFLYLQYTCATCTMCRNTQPDEALIKGRAPPENAMPIAEPKFTFADLKVHP